MSKKLLVIGVTACALGMASGVRGQDIDLSRGDADLVLRGKEANAGAGLWMDRGAMSRGDGRRDLVIGAPGAAGILGHVYVLYGGPVRSGDLSLSTSDVVITGVEPGDLFGYT